MLPLKFAQLHTTLFLAGTDHGLKLYGSPGRSKTTVSMTYDRLNRELLVFYKGETAIIPSSNVASMTPMESSTGDPGSEPMPEEKPTHRPKSQVSTPQDHVFAGPGKGKTK